MRGFRVVQRHCWGTAAATLTCSWRSSHSYGGPQPSGSSTTAGELRDALNCLGLHDDSTDAEIKKAFHAFAIQHHPDMNATGADDDMRRGTEAYHLLRQTTLETRQRVLRRARRSGAGDGATRAGHHFRDFTYTEAEYAKAQRMYQGDPGRRRSRSDATGGRGSDDEASEFDLRTEEGRRRAARFAEVTARLHELRRRGRRDDLPPWRVDPDDHRGASSTASFNAGSAFFTGPRHRRGAAEGGETSAPEDSADSQQRGRSGDGPRNPNRLGLHFFHATVSNLKEVRDLYRSRPGFAGMDGSAYDNPASAARVAPELSANPHLRQYILMKHRAQEKAIVDRAVRQPLMLFLLLVCAAVVVLMGARIAQSVSSRTRQDEEMRRWDEERGGA